MNSGHISFHFCPHCQNYYTIVFYIYVDRCDMPYTRIMLGFTHNFDNEYLFIVIVIVIVMTDHKASDFLFKKSNHIPRQGHIRYSECKSTSAAPAVHFC